MEADKELSNEKEVIVVGGGSIEPEDVKQVGRKQEALALGGKTVNTMDAGKRPRSVYRFQINRKRGCEGKEIDSDTLRKSSTYWPWGWCQNHEGDRNGDRTRGWRNRKGRRKEQEKK